MKSSRMIIAFIVTVGVVLSTTSSYARALFGHELTSMSVFAGIATPQGDLDTLGFDNSFQVGVNAFIPLSDVAPSMSLDESFEVGIAATFSKWEADESNEFVSAELEATFIDLITIVRKQMGTTGSGISYFADAGLGYSLQTLDITVNQKNTRNERAATASSSDDGNEILYYFGGGALYQDRFEFLANYRSADGADSITATFGYRF